MQVSGLESSLASSTAYPKPVVTESGTSNGQFDQIGLRPRSLITPSNTAGVYVKGQSLLFVPLTAKVTRTQAAVKPSVFIHSYSDERGVCSYLIVHALH